MSVGDRARSSAIGDRHRPLRCYGIGDDELAAPGAGIKD
jgi:hypothetical protein